jgi:hypothetical protein
MKTENIALGIAAAAALLILKTFGGKKSEASGQARCEAEAGHLGKEILDAGKPWANGWRYFNTGLAISPGCIAYKNGAPVGTVRNSGFKKTSDEYGTDNTELIKA